MPPDYYQVLGVPRDATTEQIKKAFRRLARTTHPDANPGDPHAEAHFREIAEAHEVLSDPERRARYDRGDTIDVGDLFSTFGSMDDLLRMVFGDVGFRGATTQRPRGRDVLVSTEITLVDAAFGGQHTLTFDTAVTCATCLGSGAAAGSEPIRCPRCDGQGTIRVARQSFLGQVMSVTTCDQCGGSGEIISDPCPTCRGRWITQGERTVKVEVPAGVANGNRLRLTGEGGAGPRGAPAGDLFVEIHVLPDERYVRDGDHLLHEVEIGIAEAALGTTIPVPLLDGGTEQLRIKAGTQAGSLFRLPGEGMARLNRRGRGELVVRVNVAIPTSLTSEEEELLRTYAELRGEDVRSKRKLRRT
ncbi:MAG: J domain-containing protein [Acidimicrobiia bacterium]